MFRVSTKDNKLQFIKTTTEGTQTAIRQEQEELRRDHDYLEEHTG